MQKYLETTNIPWRMLAGVFLVSIVIAIYYFTRPSSPIAFSRSIDWLAIFYPLGLGIICLQGSRELLWPSTAKPALQTSRRFVPALLGGGLLFYAFSQVIWILGIELPNQSPDFPSLQQCLNLGMYPFFIGAILCLPAQHLPLISRLRLLFDSLVIMTAGVTFGLYALLSSLLISSKGTFLAKLTISLFPGADLVLMFFLLLVALRLNERVLRPVLLMLGGAIMSLFILHLFDMNDVLQLRYNQLSAANALYLLSFPLVTGAAQTVRHIVERGESIEVRVSKKSKRARFRERGKAVLPSALVLTFALLTFIVWLSQGTQHSLAIVGIGGFLILLLMVLRQFLAVYEVSTLQREVRTKNLSLSALHTQLEQLATSDALTGLPNHQALVERFEEELTCAQASQSTFSVLFIDIDYFKSINDKYGHQTGDTVLYQFGQLVEAALRTTDHLGRWGGEEFVAVLPGTTMAEALIVAERIRCRVARQIFALNGGRLRLTCSLGIANYPENACEREALITFADQAMYTAKRLGRNQTRAADEPSVLAMGILAEEPETREELEVLKVVEALLTLQAERDQHTVQHERRVSALARRLALALGLNEHQAYLVSLGGLLHDLGKIALPDAILLKRESLTDDEFHTIRQHPVTGAEILNTVPALYEVAAMVRAHHEWVSGSGYPDGLKGAAIPLGARIVAVADAYDVITHVRPYRQAHSSAEALREIQGAAGSQFDPQVVETLLRVFAPSHAVVEVA